MSKRESKLTPKQEAAVQAFIEGASKTQAYRLAGYKTASMKPETLHRTAHALFENPKVSARVAELQNAHLERHEVTVDTLVIELEAARKMALDTETPTAAIAATMGKAKLLGLYVDRSEHTGANGKPLVPEPTSSRDVARAVLAILQDAQRQARSCE